MDEFVTNLTNFNKTLQMVNSWMKEADSNLDQIKNHSDTMTPEDRVSVTMELHDDVGEKVKIIQEHIAIEVDLLPQGDTVPKDAQDHKDELKRIEDYVLDLQKRVSKQTELFSDDVKYWAEYRTGIKEFKPWLESSEKRSEEGLTKPSTLDEASAMHANVVSFDKNCLRNMEILTNAEAASLKMTTHKEADDEVKAMKERYTKVKAVSDEWLKKANTLIKEWQLLDSTVNELNSWVATDRDQTSEQGFSLEKMESTLGELKNIFKEKERLVENL
jgi:soluble cytochrome b562